MSSMCFLVGLLWVVVNSLGATILLLIVVSGMVLCALDDNRKGWLLDEHIDLWATYLWLTRQTNMDWVMMRDCLEEKIPVVLKETGVFEKKNIDPAKYKISFKARLL
ncbi:hypothetical protein Tco_1567765 [Tanacetum coccineum]